MALLAGAALATLWVNIAPGSYYDFAEWRIIGATLPRWLAGDPVLVTPVVLVGEGLMALFCALIAKELWEAVVLERGPLAGRQMFAPLTLMAGGIIGATLVWLLMVLAFGLTGELYAGLGWTTPIGSDVVLCYLFGRMIFGTGHPALKLLLLITIGETILGLLASGLFSAAHDLRLGWLVLPALASMAVWWRFGQALGRNATLRDQQRRHVVWPYVLAGIASWAGVLAAGLPGALGLLPILPAIAHATRSFGLFAEAEGLLHDPLNRLAHVLIWPTTAAIFAFGLTYGAIDLAGFATLTIVTLAALWIGKPAGMIAAAWLLSRTGARGPLMAISKRDLICLAPLLGIAFTAPALGLPWSLPGGIMAEAARLGLAFSLLAGPAATLLARRMK